MEFRILDVKNTDRVFYPLLGPFLARRDIIKLMGEPLYDDADKTWHVAVAPTGELLGFSSSQPQGSDMKFGDAFVVERHRHKGIFTALLNHHLAVFTDRTSRVICNKDSAQFYLNLGFEIHRETKNYSFLIKKPSERDSGNKQ